MSPAVFVKASGKSCGALVLAKSFHATFALANAAPFCRTAIETRLEVEALNALTRKCAVELHTDSTYVKDGLTKWIFGWKKNGWRTADKKPVKNVELWQALDEAVARHVIDWRWVKGHNGDEMNERADQLANEGMAPFKPGFDPGRRATASRPPG